MKKIIYLLCVLLIGFGSILLTSCNEEGMDESLPLNPALPVIKSVTAMDGDKMVEATIVNDNIHFDLLKATPGDIKALKVYLHISKRAKLISHTDTVIVLDLTEPKQIVVNNLYKDITYTITASIRENYEIEKTDFKEFRMNNDGARGEGNIIYLWDGGIMSGPEKYGEIGYRNYLTQGSFTFDMGAHYYLYKFRASLYWAYTNVCPKKYQLWGYLGEGEPPRSGNWDDWTLLGSIDNSTSTLADFAAGDVLEFPKQGAKRMRYVRVRCLESYRVPPTTHISLCEVTLWAWNL